MTEQRNTTTRVRGDLYRDASRVLEQEYARNIGLTDVANRVATSSRQLQRAFREIGRTTFRDQLTDVRMRRAADLLATSSKSVAEIARSVGYRYPGQFTKAFQRCLGYVPTAYRRLNGSPHEWKDKAHRAG